MNLSIKTLDRLCLVIVIIVSLGCGYWVMSQGIRKHRQIRQENEIISKRLGELKTAKANLSNLNKMLDETRTELEALNERVPESPNIGEILRQADSLMKKRKIVLTSLQPLPTIEEKLYTKIPIRLIFEGYFVNIYHLLHDLETMNRMVVTEKMVITRPSLAKKCRVDLTASVFQR